MVRCQGNFLCTTNQKHLEEGYIIRTPYKVMSYTATSPTEHQKGGGGQIKGRNRR